MLAEVKIIKAIEQTETKYLSLFPNSDGTDNIESQSLQSKNDMKSETRNEDEAEDGNEQNVNFTYYTVTLTLFRSFQMKHEKMMDQENF